MKAVIYARYSSEKQQEISIEGQLRVCQEFAAREGYEVVDTYTDRALSASRDVERREDFQRMIRDSAAGALRWSSSTSSADSPGIGTTAPSTRPGSGRMA